MCKHSVVKAQEITPNNYLIYGSCSKRIFYLFSIIHYYYYFDYYDHHPNSLALVNVILTIHQGTEPYPMAKGPLTHSSPFQHLP